MNSEQDYLSGKYIYESRTEYIQVDGSRIHPNKLKFDGELWHLGKTRLPRGWGEVIYEDRYIELQSQGLLIHLQIISIIKKHLEKNPLKLGSVWTIDGVNISVHIFDNKEDYQNQWVD